MAGVEVYLVYLLIICLIGMLGILIRGLLRQYEKIWTNANDHSKDPTEIRETMVEAINLAFSRYEDRMRKRVHRAKTDPELLKVAEEIAEESDMPLVDEDISKIYKKLKELYNESAAGTDLHAL